MDAGWLWSNFDRKNLCFECFILKAVRHEAFHSLQLKIKPAFLAIMTFVHRWRSLALPVSPIEALACSNDTKFVAVGRENGQLELWDITEGFSRVFVLASLCYADRE
jgi:hypothetical protein